MFQFVNFSLYSVLFLAISGCSLIGMESPIARYENSTLYQPVKYPSGEWNPTDPKIEDAWFTSSDGTDLHGWYFPCDNRRAVALFAHGNAGNLSHRLKSMQLLRDHHQIDVMIFDYRGYGRSEGVPSEEGLLQDARAARKWLARRAGVSEKDIVLMGRSLGGGVMVDLAAKDGAKGLVLASTFTSLPDVAHHLMPIVPVRFLMKNRLDSQSIIGDYTGPLLQSHGDKDSVIPYELGVRLHKAAKGPKRFITIDGGDHNDPQSDEYRIAFDEFIESLP